MPAAYIAPKVQLVLVEEGRGCSWSCLEELQVDVPPQMASPHPPPQALRTGDKQVQLPRWESTIALPPPHLLS